MFLVKDGYVEVHGVDLEQFVKRHGLDLSGAEGPCGTCGATRRPTVPVVQGNYYGVIAAPCACGDTSIAPYVLGIKDGDLHAATANALEAQKKAQRIRKRRKMDEYNKKRRDARRSVRKADGKDPVLQSQDLRS